jgi:hypothetical protein
MFLEVICLERIDTSKWRSDTDDYDKGDLKDELKMAGFEDDVADSIADRIDKRASGKWNQMQARQEALREIETFMDSNRRAYENFRQAIGITRPLESAPM